MLPLVLFTSVDDHPVWQALLGLDRALERARTYASARAAAHDHVIGGGAPVVRAASAAGPVARSAAPDARVSAPAEAVPEAPPSGNDAPRRAVAEAYAGVVRSVLTTGRADLAEALAESVLQDENALGRPGQAPAGVRAAALADLSRLASWSRRDWRAESEALLADALPPLAELAVPLRVGRWEDAVSGLRHALLRAAPDELLERVGSHYHGLGTGASARYQALVWEQGELRGIALPALADASGLVALEEQLERLFANTEAFLEGRPTHDTLLYGPRGSGKSTAIRGLLPRYGDRGLCLVEVASDDLGQLPAVLERLRGRPQRFVLFVDDLSFETEDARYHPLKTLLEGSLTLRPDNVVLYATSNRRHLVKEHFSDRPDPLNDDVHGWDTHNERLALADRFGLVLTFPNATQRRYLDIVSSLAERSGVRSDDLVRRAIRFADWGNGYSGRTAQQFIDALLQERGR